jgi:hypothetical protein
MSWNCDGCEMTRLNSLRSLDSEVLLLEPVGAWRTRKRGRSSQSASGVGDTP